MNTPTPETDAKQKLKDMIGDEYVSTDFARKLERERNEAREQLDAERALADRLALALKPLLIATWREKSPTKAELAMEAWEEARRES